MKINDELEQMRKRMDMFENSKRLIDHAIKDLTRIQVVKKPRLDDNFKTPITETINEVFQTRALVATTKPRTTNTSNRGTERGNSRNNMVLNNSVDKKTSQNSAQKLRAGVVMPKLVNLD